MTRLLNRAPFLNRAPQQASASFPSRTRSLYRAGRRAAALLCLASLAYTQDIAPIRPQAPILIRPYLPVAVPPIRLTNAGLLKELIRSGMLYLTVQDTITLVLENNIDLEVSRYNPFISEWNIERAEAGGALPGVPSGASQAGSVANGQGVAGSQAAAGVSVPGARVNSSTSNATISQIGPVTPNLDPILQESNTFSHLSAPQPDQVQSGVFNLIQTTHVYTGNYQQGFLFGGVASVSYSDHFLSEDASSDLLNPTVAPNVTVSLQQNFLRGFGVAANSRTITVARMNQNITDLNFKSQVISLVSQALNLYYGLAADYQDLRAKRDAYETAQTFLTEVKRQIELGATAPSDVIAAESQLATSAQAVADSDATLRQQELSLENLISRTGAGDPILANVRIVPMDSITVPTADNLPSIDQMVRQAINSRPDLAAELATEKTSEVNALGTRNGILPTLQGFGTTSQAGLAGTPRTVSIGGFSETGDKYFAGGIGNALGQVFRRDFPTEAGGVFFQEPIHNRQAQADYAIDLLQIRQTQLTNQKDLNQVQVDVRNSVIALRQARASYETALKNRELEQALYDAEQRKYRLGASTPYNVTLQQRDLVNAESSVVAAMVAYSTARVSLDQTLGSTLEANHISMQEARTGQIPSTPSHP